MQYDVFISYSRQDEPIMRRIYDRVASAKLRAWIDLTGIKPGRRSWSHAIETAIENSRCVIVLFSPEAKKSFWVQEELSYAQAHKRPVFPVLVRGDETNAVPFGFSRTQWIDIRNAESFDTGLDKLLGAIVADDLDSASITPENNLRRFLPWLYSILLWLPFAIPAFIYTVGLVDNHRRGLTSVPPIVWLLSAIAGWLLTLWSRRVDGLFGSWVLRAFSLVVAEGIIIDLAWGMTQYEILRAGLTRMITPNLIKVCIDPMLITIGANLPMIFVMFVAGAGVGMVFETPSTRGTIAMAQGVAVSALLSPFFLLMRDSLVVAPIFYDPILGAMPESSRIFTGIAGFFMACVVCGIAWGMASVGRKMSYMQNPSFFWGVAFLVLSIFGLIIVYTSSI
jgi:hypothetical protein